MTDFEKEVRKRLIDKEMTISDLAKALSISQAYLYDILKCSRRAELQKDRISHFLQISKTK